MSTARQRVVIFISGGGSNMEALIRASRDGTCPVEIVGVVSDTVDAGGLAKAEALGVPTRAFPRTAHDSKAAHEAAILAHLDTLSPDILCLAGYMRLISAQFISRYRDRILNIHPSLLPLFPGLDTHRRAIEAGMKIAGCTVHLVTEAMDEGPILAQAAVPVLAGDTTESLAARVLVVEHRLYPAALAAFATAMPARTQPDQTLISFG